MKKLLAVSCMLLAVSLLFGTAYADSLWSKDSGSPYTTQKALRIGDIIVVIILENTSAAQKAGTDTSFQDDLSLSYTHTISRLTDLLGAANTPHGISGSGSNKYKGEGGTQRTSKVQAKVAAKVVKVFSNGNIKIEGSHKVEVNNEAQEIVISGVIRSKDVSLENTVYSYQVADASISLKGSGTVDEGAEPGWLTRILNAIF